MKSLIRSFILQWIIGECLYAILRPLWENDTASFQAVLDVTDCYPFRVEYELGERRQMWIFSGYYNLTEDEQ